MGEKIICECLFLKIQSAASCNLPHFVVENRFESQRIGGKGNADANVHGFFLIWLGVWENISPFVPLF
jgi:hypothetical protein